MIRPATRSDDDALWAILEPVLRAGETYALPRDISREAAQAYWWQPGSAVFVAEDNGGIVGTYTLKPNREGGGSHVANCGYMTAAQAGGRGIGKALCLHSLEEARRCGFRAMQFNIVVSTNTRAVHLWQACGFEIAGRLPGAFAHPVHGFVDGLVMYQTL